MHRETPNLKNYNLYASNTSLRDACSHFGASHATSLLEQFGGELGRDALDHAEAATSQEPQFGHPTELEMHPSHGHLVEMGVRYGLHCLPWVEESEDAMVVRSAMYLMAGQVDLGTTIPLGYTMVFSPLVELAGEDGVEWYRRLTSRDPQSFALCCAAFTEVDAGTHMQGHATRAERSGDYFHITGEKWWVTNPVSDAFVVTARNGNDVSPYLVPRVWQGRPNGFQFLGVHDKKGGDSVVSAHIKFTDAVGISLRVSDSGMADVMRPLHFLRLDHTMNSVACMNRSTLAAIQHSSHRRIGDTVLAEYPLMKNVLAAMCVEAEAATIACMAVARDIGRDGKDVILGSRPASEAQFLARLLVPALKFRLSKRAQVVCAEAIDTLGARGTWRNTIEARSLDDALTISSGIGGAANVVALDVLRAIKRHPECLDALDVVLGRAQGKNSELDQSIDVLRASLPVAIDGDEKNTTQARSLADHIAQVFQAVTLLDVAESNPGVQQIADAFIASTISGHSGVLGLLPPDTDFDSIVERRAPRQDLAGAENG